MKYTYASLSLRTLAVFTDLCLMFLLHMLCLSFVLQQPTLQAVFYTVVLYLVFFVGNPLILFHNIFFVHLFGGSPGKLLCGLEVQDHSGKLLSLQRAFLRQTIGYQFSAVLFGLGYMSIAKDPKHLAWHDKALGTHVVVKRKQWLLGLMVSIIGLFGGVYFLAQGIYIMSKSTVPAEFNIMVQAITPPKKSPVNQKTYQAPVYPSPSPSTQPTY